MKATLLVLVLSAGAVLPTAAESRTWISNDGRPIEGEYLRANTDSVVIRRADGKELSVRLKFLSAADREFVQAKLAAANPEPA